MSTEIHSFNDLDNYVVSCFEQFGAVSEIVISKEMAENVAKSMGLESLGLEICTSVGIIKVTVM